MKESNLAELLRITNEHPGANCLYCEYHFKPAENLFNHYSEKHAAVLWSLIFDDIQTLIQSCKTE